MNDKIKIAKNQDAQIEIIKAAMYSFTGNMIYRKWNKKDKRFERKRYQIIPIDCGITSAGNPVLYAEDYRDNKQIKMFIITQIERFQVNKRKVRPAFPIKLDNIRKMFRNVKDEDLIDEDLIDEENNNNNKASMSIIAKELIKIAQELEQFTGAQAHLYRKQIKQSVNDSKKKVFEKYNNQ